MEKYYYFDKSGCLLGIWTEAEALEKFQETLKEWNEEVDEKPVFYKGARVA